MKKMSNNHEWERKKLKELKIMFGSKCNFCGLISKLEFAHIKPTKLKGEGRGQKNRVLDIRKNKESYILLCKECHTKYDNGEIIFET